ncbi:DUF1671-domain-containing protein [Trichoderma reesei RUT C-30]|uniref:DUF1671-domain-containing protein n=1 Tax=Hypocrea jecorina (strain ATCC 56765 / BCRC 32924 / NRRL 11460 / Rut C-30) TaxID=1344414 RepID=A0A024S0H4_HYPJR|nr:DUF1671-domain-containing protein [Trichoderma reesei RUT C-30]
MTPQPDHDPDRLPRRRTAISEPDEISAASGPPDTAHGPRANGPIGRQRTGSSSRSRRSFPASLIPSRTSRLVISKTWKRLLPGRGLRANKAATARSRAKESLQDASTRHSGIHQGTQVPSRLGIVELGKYAHEDEMPAWLVRLLETKGELRAGGVVPVLQQLLEMSTRTEYAYLCHPGVQHVAKLRREGAFCGYRNIQNLCSHIIGTRATGWEQLGSDIPSVFQIQDLIETAWDRGFNARGRAETGGIKGTRKYIGTPEAQAFFASMGFPCSVQAFKAYSDDDDAAGRLLRAVERYFQQGAVDCMDRKVRCTSLPPIYLQRPNHSLTIVGLEKHKGGHVHLLVFDPEFQGSNTVVRLAGKVTPRRQSKVTRLLEPYRRSATHLERFKQFEVLYLTRDNGA